MKNEAACQTGSDPWHAIEGAADNEGESAIEQAKTDQPSRSDAGSEPAADSQSVPTAVPQEEVRQLRQALAESRKGEQMLAGLIEAAMDAVISIDESQRIVQFNPAAERMFRLSAVEALGQPIELLLPEQSRQNHADHVRAFADTGLSIRQMVGPGCVSARRADGELFSVEASISQIKVENRRLFTAILRDVSRRQRDEQALRESDERLALFAATTFEGIVVSERGRILDCNEQFANMLGYAVAELKGRMIEDLVLPEDRERVAENIRCGRESVIEHGMLRKDGGRIDVETHGKTSPRGAPGGRRLTAVRDITGHKKAEQALIEADQRKDEFLAMLAHELRNPLTPIRNAACVLGRLQSEEPRVQWAQQIIERQVSHLTRLVDDLLDVSRIVRGKVALKTERIELAAVANRALDMARSLIDAKGHRLSVRLPEQKVFLEADPVRLAQVLLNLLDNAAKYTPDGGCIELEASAGGPAVEIRVRDNGVGIPPDLLPQVFELFQQGKRTLDRSQGGLGIGLTLAKELVEMHGGLLEANSDGAGRGSTFVLRLPAWPGMPAGACAQTHAPGLAAACRIMVVEDDPAVAESMAVLLGIDGHEVRVASSGEAALQLATRFQPRLVLLDIGLQGMDGYAVARELRARQAASEKLCLVAVTGYGHDAARAQSEEAGFDRHLVKPVNPDALFELLAEIGRNDGAGASATRLS